MSCRLHVGAIDPSGRLLHFTFLVYPAPTLISPTSATAFTTSPRHGYPRRPQQEQLRYVVTVRSPVPADLMLPDLLAVKRIMQEARELANDPSTDYHAAPLEVRVLSCKFDSPSDAPVLLQDDIFVSITRAPLEAIADLRRSGTVPSGARQAQSSRAGSTIFASSSHLSTPSAPHLLWF